MDMESRARIRMFLSKEKRNEKKTKTRINAIRASEQVRAAHEVVECQVQNRSFGDDHGGHHGGHGISTRHKGNTTRKEKELTSSRLCRLGFDRKNPQEVYFRSWYMKNARSTCKYVEWKICTVLASKKRHPGKC